MVVSAKGCIVVVSPLEPGLEHGTAQAISRYWNEVVFVNRCPTTVPFGEEGKDRKWTGKGTKRKSNPLPREDVQHVVICQSGTFGSDPNVGDWERMRRARWAGGEMQGQYSIVISVKQYSG